MKNIPEDNWIDIFSYLHFKELVILSFVSKLFYSFSNHPRLWKYQIQRIFENQGETKKDFALIYVGHKYKSIVKLLRISYSTKLDKFVQDGEDNEKLPENLFFFLYGNARSGKTCLFFLLKDGKYNPKVGINLNVDMFDPGQGDWIRSIRQFDSNKASCVLYCFDLNNKSSFEELLSFWIPEVNQKYPNSHKVLIGLKSDLEQHVSDEEISKLMLKEGMKFYKVSSKEKINTDKLLDLITIDILKNYKIKKIIKERFGIHELLRKKNYQDNSNTYCELQ